MTKNIFGNCCENQGLTVLHGKMYLCPFAAHATNLDAIEKYPNDIIDTKNVESGNFKKKIEDLYFNREFIGACNYCNGRDHNEGKVRQVFKQRSLKYEKINNWYFKSNNSNLYQKKLSNRFIYKNMKSKSFIILTIIIPAYNSEKFILNVLKLFQMRAILRP